MKLQNVTKVVLGQIEANGLKVLRIVENPEQPSKDGKPVFGSYARRLLSVAEIVKATGLSKNKAGEARRLNPLTYAVPFDGQVEKVAA